MPHTYMERLFRGDFPGALSVASLTQIARALANQCRYNGNIPFYSVAQHSTIMSEFFDADTPQAVWSLLHDAHEAVLGDIIVLIDDPQTRKSAKSPVQTESRLTAINSGIVGLGGPKRGVSILLAGTKMRAGDLMDQLMDKKRHPEWNTRIFPAVRKMPDNLDLWDRYNGIRAMRGIENATTFYKKNRKAMDKGANIYWPQRFRPERGEISGIQHFMNLFYSDSTVFWSEYQNAPQSDGTLVFRTIDREKMEALCIATLQGLAQNSATWIVAHIDVHKKILYYTVAAISRDFTFRKIEHGTWPKQSRTHFTQEDCSDPIPDANDEENLFNAIAILVQDFADRRWKTEDGRTLRTNLVTIDQQWSRGIVHRVVQESPYPHLVMPYRGTGIMARHKPIVDYDKKRNKSISGQDVTLNLEAGEADVTTRDNKNEVGKCMTYGVSIARIKSDAAMVESCDVEPGTTDYLVPASGGAEVLWIAPPAESDEPRWAIIRIGGGSTGGGVSEIRGTIMEAVPPNSDPDAELPAFGRVRVYGKTYEENEYDRCGCWELANMSNEHLPIGTPVELMGPYTYEETVESVAVTRTYYLAVKTTGEYSGRLATQLDYNGDSTISVKSGSETLIFTVRATILAPNEYFQADSGVRTRRIGGPFNRFLEVIGGPCPIRAT